MLRANKASCCETFPTVRASERDNTDHPALSVYFKYDNNISVNVNAVNVQFYPRFNFYFPLFFHMEMYDNENKTKENTNEPRIKLNHKIDTGLAYSVHMFTLYTAYFYFCSFQQSCTRS